MTLLFRPLFCLAVFSVLALVPPPASCAAEALRATDWPAWRGPRADGIADGRNLPTHWTQTKNIRWSVKLPGWGTSSPVVYGNRVFVTSAVDANGSKTLLTLCFDRESGREL